MIVGCLGSLNDIYLDSEGCNCITSLSATTDDINVNLMLGTASGTDELSGIKDVEAGQRDDVITGDDKDNQIEGGRSNDRFKPGKGNDWLFGGRKPNKNKDKDPSTDTEDSFAGDVDTVELTGQPRDYSLSKKKDPELGWIFVLTDKREGSPDGINTLHAIDQLQFAGGKTLSISQFLFNQKANRKAGGRIDADDADDLLEGDDGKDELSGGFGNDRFKAGKGNDRIFGGKRGYDGPKRRDLDRIEFSGLATDYQIESIEDADFGKGFRITDKRYGQDGSDELFEIDELLFADGKRLSPSQLLFNSSSTRTSGGTVEGDDADDQLQGDVGDDILAGGEGSDTFTASRGHDHIFGCRNNQADTDTSAIDTVRFSGAEKDYSVQFRKDKLLGDIYTINDQRADAKDGQTTLVGIEQLNFSQGPDLSPAQLLFHLDVDGDGRATALGDGLMIVRKLFSSAFRGDALIDGAISPTATRNATAISDFIQKGIDCGALDIDGDGKTTALGDGLMIVRKLFSSAFKGDVLIDGAISTDSPLLAEPAPWQSIEQNIDSFMPRI